MIGDAFEREAFLRDCEAYNREIAAATVGITAIWSNVLTDRAKVNRDGTLRKYNAAFAASDGKLLESVVEVEESSSPCLSSNKLYIRKEKKPWLGGRDNYLTAILAIAA